LATACKLCILQILIFNHRPLLTERFYRYASTGFIFRCREFGFKAFFPQSEAQSSNHSPDGKHDTIISKRKFHIRRGRVSNRRVSRDSLCQAGDSMLIKKASLALLRYDRSMTAAKTRRYLSVVTANGSADSVLVARDSLESRSRQNRNRLYREDST